MAPPASRQASIDHSRYFDNPYGDEIVKFSKDECLANAVALHRKCQLYYASHEKHPRQFGSLYNGSLGTYVFIPWKLAATYRTLVVNEEESNKLLEQALHFANEAMSCLASRSYHRVTLLESPWVGAKVLQIAIWNDLKQKDKATAEANLLATQLVNTCRNLPPRECDVLYGRAGALQAILFLRNALGQGEIGHESALVLAQDILEEGLRYAARFKQYGLPLLWEWHETMYLGAAHGVVGILHTLLCLEKAEFDILDKRYKVRTALKETIRGLDKYCWPSGNLDSSIKHSHSADRLVHWCHGATGHILLLMKAFEVYRDEHYKELATKIANDVVWKRGLLKKGVGLCHGISGGAYALLTVGRYEGNTTQSRAHAFARFGFDNLVQLEGIPDQPYCLYNGVAALCTLFIDLILADDSNVRFPLYDYP